MNPGINFSKEYRNFVYNAYKQFMEFKPFETFKDLTEEEQEEHTKILLDDTVNEKTYLEKVKSLIDNEEKEKSIFHLANESYKIHNMLKTSEEKSKLEIKTELSNLEEINDETKRQIRLACHMKQFDKVSESITNLFLKRNNVYSIRLEAKQEIWIYEDGIYTRNAVGIIKEFIRDILDYHYESFLVKKILDKIEVDTFISADDFFLNQNIEEVAIQNGILNIMTKELGEFTPKKIFFNKFPITFDPEKSCPNIIKHFETVLKNSDEDINIIQEIFGYLLLKEYRYEVAFMFNGRGRNGKSKTFELMEKFIGEENTVSIPIQTLEKDKFAVCNLFGKLANICGEINSTALNNTGIFKDLCGRDKISADRKFMSTINFRNVAKMLFACNDLPPTKDTSDAFFKRWIYLEFPYQFFTKKEIEDLPEAERSNKKIKDPEIIRKLTQPEELSGLLNWALIGLHRLIKNKGFSYSKSVEDVKRIWLRKSNNFHAFMMDCVIEDYDNTISKRELHRSYIEYCRSHKITPVSEKEIKFALTTKYCVCETRPYVDDERVPSWKGVKIKKVWSGEEGQSSHFQSRRNPSIESIDEKTPDQPDCLDLATRKLLEKSDSIQDFVINSIKKGNSDIKILSESISKEFPSKFIEPNQILKSMKKKGDIFEIKPGKYEVLE